VTASPFEPFRVWRYLTAGATARAILRLSAQQTVCADC